MDVVAEPRPGGGEFGGVAGNPAIVSGRIILGDEAEAERLPLRPRQGLERRRGRGI